MPRDQAEFAASILSSLKLDRRPWRMRIIRSLIPLGLVLLTIAAVLAAAASLINQDAWIAAGASQELKHGTRVASAATHAMSEGFRTVGSMLTALGLSVAVWQWLAARHESSLDKYYDRLDVANRRYDAWRTSCLKKEADPEELQVHLYEYFVYSELDNLEYIMEKYRLGYVEHELVGRAMKHFVARCEESRFCEEAKKRAKGSGYTNTTARLVMKLATVRPAKRSITNA